MRGIFASMLGVAEWAPGDDRWYGNGHGSMSNAGRAVSPDLAMRVSAVYGCVNLLAKMVGSLPLRMYKTDPLTGKFTEAPDHPLNNVLEFQPNSWQTAWDFRAMLMMHLCLRGNAYAEIVPGPRGFADQLRPIHPDRVVRVERLPDETIRYQVLETNGRMRPLLQAEILHLRSAIAPSGLVGMSPVTYARETIGLALAAEEHGARMFSNGARPSGFVKVKKGMSDAAFERFSSQWNQNFGGLANVSKTPILEDESEFVPISLTAEDAQFIASRQFQIEEIARWFDVPLVMLHHMTNQTSWGTGVEAIMLAFVRNNLMPWLTCWTQAIRRDLILAPGIYEARFDVEELIAGDSKAKTEFYTRLVLSGVLTRNEARQALGYNPLDGLDEPLVPVTTSKNQSDPLKDGTGNNPGGDNGGNAAQIGHNGGPVLEEPQISE